MNDERKTDVPAHRSSFIVHRSDPAGWSDARARMLLDPTVANLNTGSFGPLPRPVFERVTRLRRRLAEEPMDFLVRQAPPLLWQARESLASLLGADPHRLIFTANVTAAVNLVAAALRLAAPGEVLLTDHEYGAMHWCWERAAQRQRLTLRTFPLPILTEDPAAIVEAACAAMTTRTRLVFFSHVLSPTGLVLPARELCAEARRRGILTLIDGAHGPAMVPLDLASLGCDFYGGNCHKWLLAPTGSGFLYVAPGHEDRLQPLQVSWGWKVDRARLHERDEFGSTPWLRLFEFEGTRDPCPWLAVPEAIRFQAGLGWERIRVRNGELVRHVRARVGAVAGLTPATPTNPALHGFLTAFRLPAYTDPPRLRQGLWEEHRIEVPIVERPEGPLIRVSTHFYNTEQEIDRLALVLEQLLPHPG
ncbi:MAG: aminotransferase class V-fold PLP-dependent enzyme [Gemmataceae bacterium]|nr:aminotransferase class V-fold PLP-dependent enzyme [Gemmataceae bacterium]